MSVQCDAIRLTLLSACATSRAYAVLLQAALGACAVSGMAIRYAFAD